MSKAVASYGRN